MKIALITDTHFGCRDASQIVASHQARFYREVFFPYLDEHNIKTVRHLGDLVDNRKYLNFNAMRNLRSEFIDPCVERGIDTGIIIGNHDTYLKNSNEINSVDSLFAGLNLPGLKWFDRPTEEEFDGTKIVMMPWICADTFDESIALMASTEAQVLFGHLEISGFEMYRGSPPAHGYDASLFSKFEVVCSGHFHHKSTSKNIHYLGAPYEMNWSDFDDPRGFHVFDTETRTLEYIQNPLSLFHKITYDDSHTDIDEINKIDFSHLAGCYVKLVVEKKNNPFWLDRFIDRVQEVRVADLKVIDEIGLLTDSSVEFDYATKDNLSILNEFAEQFVKDQTQLDDLRKLLGELYQEALSMEVDE